MYLDSISDIVSSIRIEETVSLSKEVVESSTKMQNLVEVSRRLVTS